MEMAALDIERSTCRQIAAQTICGNPWGHTFFGSRTIGTYQR